MSSQRSFLFEEEVRKQLDLLPSVFRSSSQDKCVSLIYKWSPVPKSISGQ